MNSNPSPPKRSPRESLNSSSNSIVVSLNIIFSRLLGIVRDQYQAFFFGIGPFATAWEIAIWLPSLLRHFIADGALSQIFIAEYSRTLNRSKEESQRLSGIVLTITFIFLIFLIALLYLLLPVLIPLITNQTAEESKIVIRITRITLLSLLLLSPFSLMSGIAHSQQKFGIPSLLQASQNFFLLIAYFAFDYFEIMDNSLQLFFLAWALVLSGFIQLNGQIFYIYYLNQMPKLNFDISSTGLKKILKMIGPAAIGLSVFQLNSSIDIIIASYFISPEIGAIPALRYASRLTGLPIGVVSTALVTTILPSISANIAKKISDGKDDLKGATLFSLFLTIPAMIGLVVLGDDIIAVLFESGKWDKEATFQTNYALQYLAFAIPFININNFIYTFFYAHQNTIIVMKIMITGVIFNLASNLTLVHSMAQGGIALSTTLSSILVSFFLFHKLFPQRTGDRLKQVFQYLKKKLLWLWLSFTGYLIGLKKILEEWEKYSSENSLLTNDTFILILLIGSSLLFYMFVAWKMRVSELEVLRMFWKRFRNTKT